MGQEGYDKHDAVGVIDQKPVEGHLESATRVVEIDAFRVVGLSAEDSDFYTNFPEENRKKIFRKVSSLSFHRREDGS